MQGGDAEAVKEPASRPPLACSECREDLQLRFDYCPFCGAHQAAAPLVDLLNGVDWQAELRAPPPPESEPEPRPDETPQPGPVLPILPGDGVDPPRGPTSTSLSGEGEGVPKAGRSKRRLVAVALILVIGAALFTRYAPPNSTGSKGRDVAAVQPSPAVPARPSTPTPVPVPAARTPAPVVKPTPTPKRSSVRLTKTWRTVDLGTDGDRTSVSIEGNGPFRVRAGRKLYVVNGSDSVELDLRGLTEVDLRAVTGSMTVDIVASRNRSLVGN